MKIRVDRFNLYLLSTLALLLIAGCETTKKKETATLKFHLEVNPDGSDRSKPVPIYRASPIHVNVESRAFLDEGHIVEAAVIDDSFGGFMIKVKFDRKGTWLLEQYSTASRGKRVAIFSQFGEARWLGAPILSKHIADGVFAFTPDATREEAERIARGLNEIAKKLQKDNV